MRVSHSRLVWRHEVAAVNLKVAALCLEAAGAGGSAPASKVSVEAEQHGFGSQLDLPCGNMTVSWGCLPVKSRQ